MHDVAMSIERDELGVPVDPAERMQQVMLGLYDLLDDACEADFPVALLNDLDALRSRFLDEFERRYPGYGQGRAVWR